MHHAVNGVKYSITLSAAAGRQIYSRPFLIPIEISNLPLFLSKFNYLYTLLIVIWITQHQRIKLRASLWYRFLCKLIYCFFADSSDGIKIQLFTQQYSVLQ